MFEPQEIGDRIQQARERAGLRQEDLADLLEVSTRTVQNYEGGATKQYAKLKQIAVIVGVTPEWLLHGDEQEPWGRDEEEVGEIPAAEIARRLREVEGLVVQMDATIADSLARLEAAIAQLSERQPPQAAEGQ